jgi:hypothetical protein
MKPHHGGRIELRLLGSDADRVRYDVKLCDPLHEWSGSAEVVPENGIVTLLGLEPAPDWLKELVRTTLRGLWRNSAAEGWPRRVARWRPEPADKAQS